MLHFLFAAQAASSAVALVDEVLSLSTRIERFPTAAREEAAAAAKAGVFNMDSAAQTPPAAAAKDLPVEKELGDPGMISQSETEPIDSAAGTSTAGAECDSVCGFSICRPPGHHATRSEGMGFCLINNAAVAARHAQHAHGLQRVGRQGGQAGMVQADSQAGPQACTPLCVLLVYI